MATDLVSRVKSDPNYIELETKRNSLGWTLTILMLVIYFGFIFLVAFQKDLLAIKVYGPVTLALVLGFIVIICAIGITGTYVMRANTIFDALTRKIVERAR
jgi:uncharacterized membrane protein (DUF485 family)